MTRLRIEVAGPLVTFQDAGRIGHLRFGVPASGPMDRLAHAAANLAIGNDARATAVEVSVGGLVLRVESGACTIAVTGGDVEIDLNGSTLPSWTACTVRAGDRVAIRRGRRGSWAYVAFAGAVDARRWLASSATHSMSGFGGGVLTTGGAFEIADSRVAPEREGEIPTPGFRGPGSHVRVVIGPQHHHFGPAAVDTLTSSVYRLTDAFDRMGVRLDGPPLELAGALSIPSEPIVRGSVQVTGDGVPTVLLADHQTTGGYPKIATVITPDLDGFVQRRSGDDVRFAAIQPEDAVAAARSDAALVRDYLASVAAAGRTLTHRLRDQNLIGGAIHPSDEG